MTENLSNTQKQVPLRSYIFFAIYSFLFPAIIFLAAGTLRWPMGWWYYGISVFTTLFSRLIVARVNPDQLRERGTSMSAENAERWDRTMSMLVGLILPVIVLVVAGLDHRWSWSPKLPTWMPVLAAFLLVLGYALATWAFYVNKFFSGVVRIQTDRGHYVVDRGPYGFVRHPGYLGGLIAILVTPMLLEALWAYLPIAFYIGVLVARTALEDQTLQEELTGYRDYAQRIRFRLIPGIW